MPNWEAMGRKSRKRPYHQEHQPLDVERLSRAIPTTRELSSGQSYSVRHVAGGPKTYLCPGCHQTIEAGIAHVVAWSNDHLFGADAGLAERRHWHKGCWQRFAR